MHVGLDHYRRGDYHAALAELEGIADAEFDWAQVLLAAIHGQLGNRDAARRVLDRANALNADVVRNPRAALRMHNVPEDVVDHLVDGLVKAGLRAYAAAN